MDEGTNAILNELKAPIDYLKPKGIHVWYNLPKPDSPLNEKLLDAFKEENKDMFEAIQNWWEEGVSFAPKKRRVFSIHHMKGPYMLLASMICKMHEEVKCTHFRLEWTPIVHYVVDKGNIFK
jgi:hypothetical protein